MNDPVEQLAPAKAAFDLPRMFETCLGCGICKGACPVFVDLFALGEARKQGATGVDALLRGSETLLSQCYFCGVCEQVCPLEFKFERMAWERLRQKRFSGTVPRSIRRRAWPMRLERWARRFARLLKWKFVRVWVERFAGVDRRALLPIYRPKDGDVAAGGERTTQGRPVVLFAGCAAGVRIPEEVRAAREILERSGFSVTLGGGHCCGLPAYAEGLVEDVKTQLGPLLEEFAGYAAGGTDILIFDSPCLKMLLKNAPHVLEEGGAIETVRPRLFDAMEYLWGLHERGALARPTAQVSEKIAYHTPCATKALGLSSPALKLLGQVPGIDLVRLDSGCCGLAGAWGMCTENFERSQVIGERNLMGLLGEAAPDSVASECPQCRLRIAGGSFTAVHPLTVYRKALGDS